MFKVRSATPADIPAMLQLEKLAPTASHWSQPQYESLFDAPNQRRLGLVLEEDCTVQAFLMARAVENEWEIENLVVAESARRRGLATRLLVKFLDKVRANGGKVVFLEVRESNRGARALYEKWEFQENSRRKMYYRDPAEDAVLYRLEL